MSKVIGIDLGTTNSCVAVLEGGEPVVIPNSEGGRTTPSVVSFTQAGERVVGEAAKRQQAVNAARTVLSIKREMGTDYRVKIDGKAYTPQEISAMILQKLRRDAEDFLGEPVSQAVITVPAYFTDSQRQATRDAGRIAGLEVLRIINEPTAAAFAYGLDHGQAQKILVYDLGGGTFDVSLIEIGDGVIEVLATSGDNHLGGDDFDERLADHLADEFKRTEKIDLRRDKAAMLRVREAAEKAKRELSGQMSTQVTLPFLTQDANGPPPRCDRHPRAVRGHDARSGGAHVRPGQPGDDGRSAEHERPGAGAARRRQHAHARRAGDGQEAHGENPGAQRQPG